MLKINILLTLSAFLFLSAANNVYAQDQKDQKNQNVVVIENYNNITSLEGEWKAIRGDDPAYKEEFYDDSNWELIPVPSPVQSSLPGDGRVVWYRVKLVLPQDEPDFSLSINFGIIDSADEVYINGKLIGKMGTIEPPYTDAYDALRIYEIPQSALRFGETNLIAVRVRYIFLYKTSGGIKSSGTVIQPYEKAIITYLKNEARKLVFVGMYIVMGIYFLFFFIQRPKGIENLYFAVFLLIFSLYSFYRTQWKFILGFDFFLTKRIEYLLLFLIPPFFLRFFYETFYNKDKGKIQHIFNILTKIIFSIAILSFLIPIFSKDYFIWSIYNRYFYYYIIYISVITIIVTLFVKSVKKNKDAVFLLIGCVPFIITIIIDILYNIGAINFGMTTPFGLALFMLSIAIVLTNRFVRIHKQLEIMNVDLEELDVLKEGFISNFTREIWPPLTTIYGNIELLNEKEVEEKNEIDLIFKSMYQASENANSIINEIFILTKIETRDIHPVINKIEITRILNNIIDENIELTKKRNISVDKESSNKFYVLGDIEFLKIIFTEIYKNAVIYNNISNNGEIQISVHSKEGPAVEVAIFNTGPGIDESIKNRIYNKFVKKVMEHDPNSEGKGIGLYIVYHLIEALKGSIRFESKNGEGVTFFITLAA